MWRSRCFVGAERDLEHLRGESRFARPAQQREDLVAPQEPAAEEPERADGCSERHDSLAQAERLGHENEECSADEDGDDRPFRKDPSSARSNLAVVGLVHRTGGLARNGRRR